MLALRDAFERALERAEDVANETLDTVLSEGNEIMIKRMDSNLRNREVSTEAEVEALVGELRTRLLEQVRAGKRVRLQ